MMSRLSTSSPSPSSITFSPEYEDYGAQEGSLLDVLKETIAEKLGIKTMNNHEKPNIKHDHGLKALVRTTPQTRTL
jgi:hypothetical protein